MDEDRLTLAVDLSPISGEELPLGADV